MNLVFSGGHITPALALMQKAKERGDHVIVLGKAGKHGPSVEERETKKVGFDFFSIPQWKYHRYSLLKSLFQIPQGIMAILRSYQLIRNNRCHVCVVFGGYMSLPVALAAKAFRLPVFLHEQTMNPGLGSRLVSRFTPHIYTSFPQAKFNRPATLIGNLIRKEFYQPNPTPAWMPQSLIKLPLIYITGGHQGSGLINDVVSSRYSELTQNYLVIHQCGGTGIHDYATPLEKLRLKLYKEQQSRLIIKPWFPASQAAWLMQHASMIIGRAGANTVSELLVCQTPALLIPLLSDPRSEQYLQAKFVADQGLGQVILEEDLTADRLITAIKTFQSVKSQPVKNTPAPSASSVTKMYDAMIAAVEHA
jgi:UDP-N-acetylglucosamine--N-acetylmuramyl-(pentapeptide) pyrophosphoryl-undecaprenol N-acetylglucosamine transferase